MSIPSEDFGDFDKNFHVIVLFNVAASLLGNWIIMQLKHFLTKKKKKILKFFKVSLSSFILP